MDTFSNVPATEMTMYTYPWHKPSGMLRNTSQVLSLVFVYLSFTVLATESNPLKNPFLFSCKDNVLSGSQAWL